MQAVSRGELSPIGRGSQQTCESPAQRVSKLWAVGGQADDTLDSLGALVVLVPKLGRALRELGGVVVHGRHELIGQAKVLHGKVLVRPIPHEDRFHNGHVGVIGQRGRGPTDLLANLSQALPLVLQFPGRQETGNDERGPWAQARRCLGRKQRNVRGVPRLVVLPARAGGIDVLQELARPMDVLVVQGRHHHEAIGQRTDAEPAAFGQAGAAVHEDVIVRDLAGAFDLLQAGERPLKAAALQVRAQDLAHGDEHRSIHRPEGEPGQAGEVVALGVGADEVQAPQPAEARGHLPELLGRGRGGIA